MGGVVRLDVDRKARSKHKHHMVEILYAYAHIPACIYIYRYIMLMTCQHNMVHWVNHTIFGCPVRQTKKTGRVVPTSSWLMMTPANFGQSWQVAMWSKSNRHIGKTRWINSSLSSVGEPTKPVKSNCVRDSPWQTNSLLLKMTIEHQTQWIYHDLPVQKGWFSSSRTVTLLPAENLDPAESFRRNPEKWPTGVQTIFLESMCSTRIYNCLVLYLYVIYIYI